MGYAQVDAELDRQIEETIKQERTTHDRRECNRTKLNNELQVQVAINKITRAQIHLASVKEHVCGISNIAKADEVNQILLAAREVLKNVIR